MFWETDFFITDYLRKIIYFWVFIIYFDKLLIVDKWTEMNSDRRSCCESERREEMMSFEQLG